jgi:hypothetical protein
MTDTQKIHQFAEQNMLVEKYLLGELGGANLEDFEQHLFECSICFYQVKAGQEFAAHIRPDEAPCNGFMQWLTRGSMQWWRRIKDFWRGQ